MFLGLGAYAAAILASNGFADPLLGLAFGSGIMAPLLLRGGDLTRLMVTLGVSLTPGELANHNGLLTACGGRSQIDGASARLFPIGFTGQRNAALYSFAVLFICSRSRAALGTRRLWRWPRTRENRLRAAAPRRRHQPTHRRGLYGCGGLRGRGRAAGADDPDRAARPASIHSADVMLMLIIGGAGYLYGGLARRRSPCEGRDFRSDARIFGSPALALVILVCAIAR